VVAAEAVGAVDDGVDESFEPSVGGDDWRGLETAGGGGQGAPAGEEFVDLMAGALDDERDGPFNADVSAVV
jgi:hypothetical protein